MAGVNSYIEVIDAQRDASIVIQPTVQARRPQLSTAAPLYSALGGGQEPRGPGGT